jgi:hypothetical protein
MWRDRIVFIVIISKPKAAEHISLLKQDKLIEVRPLVLLVCPKHRVTDYPPFVIKQSLDRVL